MSDSGPKLEELRRRLEERRQRELEAVVRRLSVKAESCRCGQCVEDDLRAREEREDRGRWGRWNGA